MSDNPQLDLARKFLEQTATNIFLTGRAGTGKTTFLRRLAERSPKRMIVVAPTGVAAVNAGGVTIHSFFQLSPSLHLPGMRQEEPPRNFTREKTAIIRSLDLLVIDEISMVRADLLDAVSDVLRRYRDRSKPFGGVQLLLIGDLQQLAPVVTPRERELLGAHYASPYFFASRALQAAGYVTIELRQIYRQRDGAFIEILNRVRENRVDRATLDRLNARCTAGSDTDEQAGCITLTSHNETARSINERRMEALDTPAQRFESRIEGEFPEYLYPTDRTLTLKAGAQVMFVRNDPTGLRRYFNGKIGRIVGLDADRIEVAVDDSPDPIEVETAEWTNLRYGIDPDTQQITQSVEGVFRQFPLRAAWAITIHKSQGLTFDRVAIDAAHAFSHGQVYVALSRCRRLEGLVLRTPLRAEAFVRDPAVGEFDREAARNRPDEALFEAQRRTYYRSLLEEMFDFTECGIRLQIVRRIFDEHLEGLYPEAAERWRTAAGRFAEEIGAVGRRFRLQLERLLAESAEPESDARLSERIEKARAYFGQKCREIVAPLLEQSAVETDNKELAKRLANALDRLDEVLHIKLAVLGMACADGFRIADYLETRARATLDRPKRRPAEKGGKQTAGADAGQEVANPELYERLRTWRREQAAEEGIPAYVVMQQTALLALCRELPRDAKELAGIKGVGKVFLKKYGEQVLSIVGEWADGQAAAQEQ